MASRWPLPRASEWLRSGVSDRCSVILFADCSQRGGRVWGGIISGFSIPSSPLPDFELCVATPIGRPRLESYEIAHEFAHAEFAHEAVSSCISIEHLKPLRVTFSSSSSCACGCRSRCSPRTLSYPWSRPGADDPSRSSCRSSRARPRPHPPRTPRSHLWS